MPRKGQTKDNLHKRKIKRGFLLKKDAQMGERKKTAYIMSSFRNIFYNTLEHVEELTVLQLSVVLWAYPYTFFNRETCYQRLRISPQILRRVFPALLEKGYIEEYSSGYYMQAEREKYSDIMDMTYMETYDKFVTPTYRLTRKSTLLVHKMVDEIDGNLINSFPYETRQDKEKFIFISWGDGDHD